MTNDSETESYIAQYEEGMRKLNELEQLNNALKQLCKEKKKLQEIEKAAEASKQAVNDFNRICLERKRR